MPRFYFDISDGRCSPDPEGLHLTDEAAARCEGIRRVAMLLRATHNGRGMLRGWRLAVRDETGLTLFCIDAPSGVHLGPTIES